MNEFLLMDKLFKKVFSYRHLQTQYAENGKHSYLEMIKGMRFDIDFLVNQLANVVTPNVRIFKDLVKEMRTFEENYFNVPQSRGNLIAMKSAQKKIDEYLEQNKI